MKLQMQQQLKKLQLLLQIQIRKHVSQFHSLKSHLFIVCLGCSRDKGRYFGRTDKCYILFTTNRDSWNSSRSFCQNQYSGGDLASITDRETNDFIKNTIKILTPTWLGGVRVNDKWTWIDGATWTEFENSNMKENNRRQDYLAMDRAYEWGDNVASVRLDYLCQY